MTQQQKTGVETVGEEAGIYGNYTVGGTDIVGRKIKEIYFGDTGYVVYKAGKSLSWYYDSKTVNRADLVAVAGSNARIKSLTESLPGVSRAVEAEVARAMEVTLLGYPEEANRILGRLEATVRRQRKVWGQLRYLGSASLPVAILVFAAIFCARGSDSLLEPRLEALLHVVTAGALAGFLSVAAGLRDLDIDVDQHFFVDLAYGLSRIAVAGVASVFAYVLMKAGVFFGTLDDGSAAGILTVAAAAGFSETLVPNLLKRTVDSAKKEGEPDEAAPGDEVGPAEGEGAEGEVGTGTQRELTEDKLGGTKKESTSTSSSSAQEEAGPNTGELDSAGSSSIDERAAGESSDDTEPESSEEKLSSRVESDTQTVAASTTTSSEEDEFNPSNAEAGRVGSVSGEANENDDDDAKSNQSEERRIGSRLRESD